MSSPTFQEQVKSAVVLLSQIQEEIHKKIIGQDQLVRCLLMGILADGHLLLEGVPGVAKTLAAKTLAKVIDCQFKRVQFTPDLLPADLIGTAIFNPDTRQFEVKKGPLFTQILLADEINRAPAKVQSALLEIMQEKQVTINGETFKIAPPFIVLATQNPIEQEGTYPLSEAQSDRFMMKIKVDYPSQEEEKKMLIRMSTEEEQEDVYPILTLESLFKLQRLVQQIYLDDKVTDYILNLVSATRFPKKYGVEIEGLLDYGASPRASIALMQLAKASALFHGRYFVIPEDIRSIIHEVLRHRLRLSYEAEAENLSADAIIDRLLDAIPVP